MSHCAHFRTILARQNALKLTYSNLEFQNFFRRESPVSGKAKIDEKKETEGLNKKEN